MSFCLFNSFGRSLNYTPNTLPLNIKNNVFTSANYNVDGSFQVLYYGPSYTTPPFTNCLYPVGTIPDWDVSVNTYNVTPYPLPPTGKDKIMQISITTNSLTLQTQYTNWKVSLEQSINIPQGKYKFSINAKIRFTTPSSKLNCFSFYIKLDDGTNSITIIPEMYPTSNNYKTYTSSIINISTTKTYKFIIYINSTTFVDDQELTITNITSN
jgi:hypothetical protein